MALAQQHRGDRRQVRKRDAGRRHPLRPGEADRAGARRPDRVGEQVEPRGLDQQRRVADGGNPQAVDARIGRVGVTGTVCGDLAAPPASFQRSTWRRVRSVAGASGLKNRVPSKWSLGGPA